MKSKKLLSCVMALSVIATSSVALGTTANAASAKDGNIVSSKNIQSLQSSYAANYSNFSYYTTISESNLQKIKNYYNSSHPEAWQLNEFLVKNGITTNSVANIISYQLYHFIGSMTSVQDYYGTGITFLKVPNTNLVKLTMIPNDQLNYSFKLYTKILSSDVYKIVKYMDDNPKLTSNQLTSYLINNGMVSSYCANNVANLLLTAGHGKYKATDRINTLNYDGNADKGILVLQATTNSNALVLAPQEY